MQPSGEGWVQCENFYDGVVDDLDDHIDDDDDNKDDDDDDNADDDKGVQVGGECLASFLYVLLVSLAEELVASSPGLPPSSRWEGGGGGGGGGVGMVRQVARQGARHAEATEEVVVRQRLPNVSKID